MRVNPDIDAGTHPHISTGLHINKFGVPLEQARGLYLKMSQQPGLQPVGIHVHLGSQIISTEPIQRAAAAVVRLARELRDVGVQLDHIDIGGGLGISYDGSRRPRGRVRRRVLPIIAPSGLSIALEPAGTLSCRGGAARARGRSEGCGRRTSFRGARRGMTELMRPMLYAPSIASSPFRPARLAMSATTSWDPCARAPTRLAGSDGSTSSK